MTLQLVVTISSQKPFKFPHTELSCLLRRPEQHTAALGLRQNFVLLVLELRSKMTMSESWLPGGLSPCSADGLLPACPHMALPLQVSLGS